MARTDEPTTGIFSRYSWKISKGVSKKLSMDRKSGPLTLHREEGSFGIRPSDETTFSVLHPSKRLNMARNLKLISETDLTRLIVDATLQLLVHKDMTVKDALYDILSYMDELQVWLEKYPSDD